MKKCIECGKESYAMTKYCSKCGSNKFIELDLRCKKCNGIIFEKDNFCEKCGKKIKEKYESIEINPKKYSSIDEIMVDMKKKWKWYDYVEQWWYKFFIYKIYKFLSDTTPRVCIKFIQRGIRGWSDEDLWNFDSYLTEVILTGLIELKNTKKGFPIIDRNIKEDDNEKLWNDIMDKMIDGFAIMRKCDIGEELKLGMFCSEEQKKEYNEIIGKKYGCRMTTKEEEDKIREAFKLLGEHYWSLWD